MNEADLNTIVKNSVNETIGGWAYKIPDPQGQQAISAVQRPYDGFGFLNYSPLYWEGKFQKGYKAFNFKRIEDHQIDNLTIAQVLSKKNKIPVYSCVALGVWQSREYFDVFFFDIESLNQLIGSGKKSILKKELEHLKVKGMCVPVKKKLFNIEDALAAYNKTKEYIQECVDTFVEEGRNEISLLRK